MSTIALHSTLYISETVRDRGLVPKDHQQEMVYGVSNGHVTDDVTWPRKSQTRDPNTAISRKQLDMLFSKQQQSLITTSSAVRQSGELS